MSWITAAILAIFFGGGIGYFIVKRLSLNGLNAALKNEDYQGVIGQAEGSMNRKLLGEYVCDLYKLRAYVLLKDNDHVREHAKMMLYHTYSDEQHKAFLELYYHIFLNRNDLEMADLFLEEIKKLDDYLFTAYNEATYEVLVHKRTDKIEDMERHIEAKVYHGFPLGTLVYLIAMQYLYMEDYKNAKIYFQECIDCFHPNAIYVGLAKAQIKKLNDQMIEPEAAAE